MKRGQTQKGFTIVELLIVIVVIGILAAVTVVAYNNVQSRAKKSTLISDVTASAKQLKMDRINSGSFPATVNDANSGQGLKASPGTSYRYAVNNSANPQTFCLTATNGSTFYSVTENSTASEGSCVNVASGASATSSMLTDGVTTTNPYFSMASGLISVTVSLASAQDISTLKVWLYYADGRTYYATKTEVSEDNVNWTTVFDSATEGTYAETSAGRTTTFPARKVRYIRDWLNGSTSNTGNHWVEIQAY